MLLTPSSAIGSCVEEAGAARSEERCPFHDVSVERVAAIDDDVASLGRRLSVGPPTGSMS